MTLERRQPMRRGKPLQSRSTLARRTRIKPVSDTRRGQRDANAAIREEVFARDGWACQIARLPGAGPCFGRLTFGHRRKAGQGGAYTLANGSTQCAHHNDLLEADADLAAAARAAGIVVRRGDPEWEACG